MLKRTATGFAAAVLAAAFMVATLPTPLYQRYQQRFALTPTAETVIYAVYVAGTLAVLATLGRLSDSVGRRLTSLLGLAVCAAALVCFVVLDSVSVLALARVLSGLGLALVSAAATAWVAELHPHRSADKAAALAAASTLGGEAFGAVITGVLASVAPAPFRVPYLAGLVVLIAAAAIASAIPETVNRKQPISLRPRFTVPAGVRDRFGPAAGAAFVVFGLVGFYSAIVPSLLRQGMRVESILIGALVVAAMFAIAALSVYVGTRWSSRRCMQIGLWCTAPAAVLLAASQLLRSGALLGLATLVAGFAVGQGYRGSLQVVNHLAPAGQRAGVLASYMLIGSAGLAVPVIGVGLVTQLVDASVATSAFAAVVALIGIVAAWVERQRATGGG